MDSEYAILEQRECSKTQATSRQSELYCGLLEMNQTEKTNQVTPDVCWTSPLRQYSASSRHREELSTFLAAFQIVRMHPSLHEQTQMKETVRFSPLFGVLLANKPTLRVIPRMHPL